MLAMPDVVAEPVAVGEAFEGSMRMLDAIIYVVLLSVPVGTID